MAVTITDMSQIRRGGSFQSSENMTQSTATAAQALSLSDAISTLSGGTASGDNRNDLYSLADGVEGQEKMVVMLATGEAALGLTSTATGLWVFSAAEDVLHLRFINELWRPMLNLGATFSTGT